MELFTKALILIITTFILIIILNNYKLLSTENIDWENPKVIDINKEQPHATLMPYEDMAKAIEGNRSASNYY